MRCRSRCSSRIRRSSSAGLPWGRTAVRRGAPRGKGWYGFAQDLDGTAKCVEGLKAACKTAGRRFEDVEVSITPKARVKVDRDTAKRYPDLGVSRLILLQRGADEGELLKGVREVERELIGKV